MWPSRVLRVFCGSLYLLPNHLTWPSSANHQKFLNASKDQSQRQRYSKHTPAPTIFIAAWPPRWVARCY